MQNSAMCSQACTQVAENTQKQRVRIQLCLHTLEIHKQKGSEYMKMSQVRKVVPNSVGWK